MKSKYLSFPFVFVLLICLPLTTLAKPKPPSLETRVAALEAQVAALQTLLGNVYRLIDPNTGVDTLRFEGMNLQVVNGTGETESTNETGNLIIGYNETRYEGEAEVPCPSDVETEDECNRRTGSHNLIIGSNNNYSSYGGMVVGYGNEIAASFASVSGGLGNVASGEGFVSQWRAPQHSQRARVLGQWW